MNTPAHLLLNLAVLPRGRWAQCGLAVLAGALLPDLPMFVFYAWQHLVAGRTEVQIWAQTYYEPGWQNAFDLFNSIPLIALLGGIGVVLRRPWVQALALSMLLHCLFDLALHNDDAHRHFFPFSDWRFASPVSYWDPRFYGHYFLAVESSIVLGAALAILRARRERWLRGTALALALAYVAFLVYALLVWG